MTMSTGTPTRRARSDGERSRRVILEAAARLATLHGLDRLSIGELARHAGFSKSGLYAHFGSKEELQLATIDAAEELFARVVVAPMHQAEAGLPAVLALADAFIAHLRDRVFPGGCFFACASAEVHAKPGPVKDRIEQFDHRWRGRFREQLETARQQGQLDPGDAIDEIVFDLDALLLYAHAAFSFRGDPGVLDEAARAVRRRLRVA
jgi:AcrR family transcriptional regulator